MTALQIAKRLGYVSVEQVLQSVTNVSDSTEDLNEDYKYSMVGPEKMEEHSISDSEEEQGKLTYTSVVAEIFVLYTFIL